MTHFLEKNNLFSKNKINPIINRLQSTDLRDKPDFKVLFIYLYGNAEISIRLY